MQKLIALMSVVVASLLLVIATAQAATTPATFTTRAYPFLANYQISVDLNLDGHPDIAGTGLNAAHVMLNNGDGTFQPKVSFAVGGQTQELASGDFNGDTIPDLVVTLINQQFSHSVLIGTGTGTFNAAVNYPNTTGADSSAVATTDLNNDGKLDIAIAHGLACFVTPCTASPYLSLILGNGDGTFQPSRDIVVGNSVRHIVASDFNRDGNQDLAISAEGTRFYFLRGNGDGTFVQQPTFEIIPGEGFSAGTDMDIADFNRDGLQDLAVALPGNGGGTAILIGNGDATFRTPFRITNNALDEPQSIAIGDFNRDGFQDIARALGFGNQSSMDIVNGNGDGTFQPARRYLTTTPPSTGGNSMVADDFNGDGRTDIALSIIGNVISLSVLTNTTGAVPPPSTATPTRTVPPIPTSTPTSVPQTPILSSVTLSPGIVTGGSNSTGTVRLSAAAQASTTIQLSSNNAAASVSASVVIPAGATSANFTVTTTRVSSATTATISASLGTVTRSASLTINPQATDTVAVTRAEYDNSRRLRIEATSTNSSATLSVYATSTNQLIGTLSNNGGGRYSGQFTWPSNPQNVTVRSSLGGSASRAVTQK